MGVSGPGLYEDDDFFMYLLPHMEILQKDIENCFRRHERGKLNLQDVNDTLVPAIDIVITLYEKYGHSISVTESTIRSWKQAVLKLYDDKIDDFGADRAFKEERRHVIEDLFDRFELTGSEDEEPG